MANTREKTYWLHRISHWGEIARPLLDRGYLSIGFSSFSLEGFDLVKAANEENSEAVFDDAFLSVCGEKTRARWSLWRFILKMKKGDVVLVPGWKNFSVYELLEDNPIHISEIPFIEFENLTSFSFIKKEDGRLFIKKQNGEELVDLGYFRKAKLLAGNISRSDYAGAKLSQRLKYQGTNTNISDLRKDIERAINNFEEKRPHDIHSNLKKEVAPIILETLKRDLDDKKLEDLIKRYFESLGATAFIPPKNGKDKEGDADVVAVFEHLKSIIYTQAKCHDGITDDWAVEQISNYSSGKEAMDDEYTKIRWVVSSAEGFSDKAKSLARQNQVRLINGILFSEMLLDAGVSALRSTEG
ncbi:MAG: restriction endonuclease [Burkholderiales bacterium]|jgi:predicted Mrr-cat superfamily restriction endonuclease|nr:restriction endonuclease [Burkholderiales bacterium]